MVLLHERVLLPDLVVEAFLDDSGGYRLRYGDLVEYTNGKRRIRGRTQPYEFRSVEQMRYDFERDVRALAGADAFADGRHGAAA